MVAIAIAIAIAAVIVVVVVVVFFLAVLSIVLFQLLTFLFFCDRLMNSPTNFAVSDSAAVFSFAFNSVPDFLYYLHYLIVGMTDSIDVHCYFFS